MSEIIFQTLFADMKKRPDKMSGEQENISFHDLTNYIQFYIIP